MDTIQMNKERKIHEAYYYRRSVFGYVISYHEDWANCFTLEHNNRRPMDVCFAFISPQMASVLIMVSGLTIMHIHLA